MNSPSVMFLPVEPRLPGVSLFFEAPSRQDLTLVPCFVNGRFDDFHRLFLEVMGLCNMK